MLSEVWVIPSPESTGMDLSLSRFLSPTNYPIIIMLTEYFNTGYLDMIFYQIVILWGHYLNKEKKLSFLHQKTKWTQCTHVTYVIALLPESQ